MLDLAELFNPIALWIPILLPAAIVALALLCSSVNCRMAFVAVGGFAVLQSSTRFDAAKGLYAIVFTLVFAIALFKAWSCRDRHWTLLSVSAVLFALAGLSLFVALAHGNSPGNWLRDVASLLLLAAAPIFALDAQHLESPSATLTIFVVAGVAAAIAFVLERLGGRHLAQSGQTWFLYTFLLPVALFSYAAAESFAGTGAGRLLWIVVSGAVASLLLASSGRSAFAVLLLPVAMVFIRRGSLLRAMIRAVEIGALAALLFYLVAAHFAHLAGVKRQTIIKHLLEVETLVHNPHSDPSFRARLYQTLAAAPVFLQSPLLGAGPGRVFTFKGFDGKPMATFAIFDTPLAFPAKYGLVGIGLLLVAASALCGFIRSIVRERGMTPPVLALISYALFSIGRMLLGSPFDDKGYSMGLMFLLALCLIDARSAFAPCSGAESRRAEHDGYP